MRVIQALTAQLEATPPSVIQYIPGGTNKITAKVDGVPAETTVTAGPEHATALQASLERRLSENVRPILDFDHQDTGPAAGIPKRFYWDDGVMLEVEWTGAGKRALEGRDYSYFSPLFMVDKDGCPACLHDERPVGALVNDPAFRNIRRIAAKKAELETNKPSPQSMDHDFTPLVEAGILKAEQAKLSNVVSLIAAAFAATSGKLKTAEAAQAKAEEERDEANKILQAAREADADAAVERAIEAGRISAKDEDSKTFWKEAILEKGADALKQLEATNAPAKGLGLSQQIINPGGGSVQPSAEVEAANAAKVRNRATEIQASQGIPFPQAWQQAKSEASN